METVLKLPGSGVTFNELFAAQRESAHTAQMVSGIGVAVTGFSACYARELSSLVWFVMSLG